MTDQGWVSSTMTLWHALADGESKELLARYYCQRMRSGDDMIPTYATWSRDDPEPVTVYEEASRPDTVHTLSPHVEAAASLMMASSVVEA